MSGVRASGRYPHALGALETALDADPDDAGLRIELAKSLAGLGQLAEAAEQASLATRMAPTSASILSDYARILRQAGRDEEAVEVLCDGLSDAGVSPDLLHDLTSCVADLARTGGMAGGTEYALRALSLRSVATEPTVALLLALALDRVARPATQLATELELRPAGDAITVPLASLLVRKRNDEIDVSLAARIGRMRSLTPEGLVRVLVDLHDTGRTVEAYALILSAVEAGRASPDDLLGAMKGEWSEVDHGHLMGVKREGRTQSDISPAMDTHLRPAVQLRLALTALEAGDLLAAEARFRLALAFDPLQVDARIGLAQVLIRKGSTGEALGVLGDVHPEDPRVLAERIRIEAKDLAGWSPSNLSPSVLERFATIAVAPPAQLPTDVFWRLAQLMFHAGRDRDALSAVVQASGGEEYPWGLLDAAFDVAKFSLGMPEWDEFPSDPAEQSRMLMEKGLSLAATRQTSKAAACFQIARQLDRTDPAASLNAGFFLDAAGEPEAAAAAFEEVREAYPPLLERVAWPAHETKPWPWAALRQVPQADAADWPRVTVITPSLNQGEYIEETILSVIGQGYPNLQYIVVDGGSTDGTGDVLARYADHFDHLIVEPDRGQADAINKGLRLADGALVTWLNSDDMYAPGALRALGAAYREEPADLLYGMCLTHWDYQFEAAILPAATQDTFTVRHLGDIFEYWMRNHFFHQPEVIFSKDILDRVGGQLADLQRTMDYDLWMRFAQAGARIRAVHRPVALFRKHDAQKTTDLTGTVLEQVAVRDRFVSIEPSPERERDIRGRLTDALAVESPRVAVVSARMPRIFSSDSAADLQEALASDGWHAELLPSLAGRESDFDIVIYLLHLLHEADDIRQARMIKPTMPVLGWFWDNHHHVLENAAVVDVLDVTVPGHHFASAYLHSRSSLLASSVPLCVTQWSHREAASLFRTMGHGERTNRLYGGFGRYGQATERNALVASLAAREDTDVQLLDPHDLDRYFALSQARRFAAWSSHKTSLCLPLHQDLSQRLFDALLTGQVPVVPSAFPELDRAISQADQEALRIVRFDEYTVKSVMAAHDEAVDRFDDAGAAGVQRRHEFVLGGHMLPTRIARLLEVAQTVAAGSKVER